MSSKDRRTDNLEPQAAGRLSQRIAAVLLLIIVFMILVATGIKLHETLVLPRNYRDLNRKALAQIQKDYAKLEREFIDPN